MVKIKWLHTNEAAGWSSLMVVGSRRSWFAIPFGGGVPTVPSVPCISGLRHFPLLLEWMTAG
jgi:hypothetical protein